MRAIDRVRGTVAVVVLVIGVEFSVVAVVTGMPVHVHHTYIHVISLSPPARNSNNAIRISSSDLRLLVILSVLL